ncbi:putative transposase [Trichonephila clavipes]|nr:putative transposase [Trichonephila clavipes]
MCYQVLLQTWTQRNGIICITSASLRRQCFVKGPVNRFLASKNIPVAPQPPYSPDLSPCDFFLFPKLKNPLKGHHFGTLENIQTAVTDQLKAIPISEFHQCYEEWKKRLQRCVASEGSYFEGV